MKLPSKIKIGGHWVEIVIRSESKDMYTNAGTRAAWQNRIYIQEDMAESKQWSTLFHEILHEIDWQMNLGLSGNEKAIDAMGEGFYQVLADNGLLKIKVGK